MFDEQSQFLRIFLQQIPYTIIPLVTMFGGLATAIVCMSKYPREAVLTLIAMLLLIATTIMGPVLNAMQFSQSDARSDVNQTIFSLLNFGRQFVSTGAFVLLFIAIFGNRTPKNYDQFGD